MIDFAAAMEERVLVCDGAMGTMLHASGIPLDRALPELNLSNQALVRAIHDRYLAAGVDIIQTNTFGATRLRLGGHGYADLVREINLAGARIALQARAAAGRPVLVAGSISPAVSVVERGQVDREARIDSIRQQVEALVEGGVDLLIFETYGYLSEMVEALQVASATCALPLVAQLTFADDGQTLGGETPQQVAETLSRLPVTVIGTNCTLGPQGVLRVLRELSRYTELPLSAQPNAGVPRMIGRRRFEYSSDSDYIARHAARYAEVGARLVGGCCGTTPDHIKASVSALRDVHPVRRMQAAGSRDRGARPARDQDSPDGRGGSLAEQLAARRFIVAVELTPPLGGRPEQATELAAEVRRRGVNLISIAPSASARAQMSPLSLALHLQQRVEVEALLVVTTWDRSIMTLQADLLGAHALGIRTVICRTGSPPLRGDYPNVDGIWEVDSLGLIGLLSGLNHGQDCNGIGLETATSFCIGARFNPSAPDVEAELARTRAKVRAGAQFLVTWPLHELAALRLMLEAVAESRVPVLLAVRPLRSYSEAEYLRHEVPGAMIPDAVLDAMRRAGEDDEEVGLRLAEEMLERARGLVQGVLLTLSSSSPPVLDRLLRAAGVARGPSAQRPRGSADRQPSAGP